MTNAEKIELAGARLRTQRTRMHAARLERREQALRDKIEGLQAELERQRTSRQDLLDVMKERRNGMSMGGTLKLLVVGGAAYVLGTKAGRARYDQIVTWARRTKDDGERKVSELAEAAGA